MDDDVKSGLWGCGSLFFVVGVILAFCFQCAFDRQAEERENFKFESAHTPPIRAKSTWQTTPSEKPMDSSYEWRKHEHASGHENESQWARDGYDSFEDWYYAEMDVVGEGEYPDM